MDNMRKMTNLPNAYISTWKATVLAIIKLLEALTAGFVLFWFFSNEPAVLQIVGDINKGLTSLINMNSPLYSFYCAVIDIIQYVVIAELVLFVLDGLGSFFLRVAHKGAAFVKHVHLLRYVISVYGFIISLIIIFQYIVTIYKAVDTAISLGYANYIDFQEIFELVLSVTFVVSMFLCILKYDRYVVRIMEHVSKETKAGEILPFYKENCLGREASIISGVLLFSAILSAGHLLDNRGALAEITNYIRPIEILYKGSDIASIVVVSVLAIKFLLVKLCSADFDRVH